MDVYELTQKMLSIGNAYEVRARGGATGDEVLYAIKGKVLSMTPSLSMHEGPTPEGAVVCAMKGNFLKTRFDAVDTGGSAIGSLVFPTLSFKQTFSLTTSDGATFQADGGFLGGRFTVTDASGGAVLVIAKELTLRDRYSVSTTGTIPLPLALLATVAIQQRFMATQAALSG